MRSRVPGLITVLSRLIFLVGLVCVPVAAARADTIVNFSLSSDLSPGLYGTFGTPSGTVTVDTTTGVIGSISLTYLGEPNPFPSNNTSSTIVDFVGLQQFVEFGEAWDGPSYEVSVDIVLPVDTLVGYMGGPICSEAAPCYINGDPSPVFSRVLIGGGGGSGDAFADGDLATPEPSGFVLLGTSVLGLAGAVRRRAVRG